MPLILIALCFVALFAIFGDNNKEFNRQSANYTKSTRKTNAEKERKILDDFMKSGKSFSEAYDATLEEMVRLGYEPCIPKSGYGEKRHLLDKTYDDEECSYMHSWELWECNSKAVQTRIKQLEHDHLPLTEENIYADFPEDEGEYVAELRRLNVKQQAIPIGELFIYPNYGTVRVLAHDFSLSSLGIGYYQVKVLKTGEIQYIRIGDPNIRQLGSRD